MKICRFLSIFFLIIFSAILYSEAVTGVKITRIFGDVQQKKSGQAEWNKNNTGDILNANDSIRTGTNSYAEMEISPKNSVRIKEKTQILIKDLDKESKEPDGSVVKLTDFNLIEGDIALKLDKLPKDTLVRVSSPTAVAGARGTAYVVRYDPNNKIARVGVLEHKVAVSSVGEPSKIVEVPVYKKVSITPWAMALAQVRGTGILSEAILGKQFIEESKNPIIEAVGAGDTEEKARDNAYYNIAIKVLSISIRPDKRIEDVLNENPSLCGQLYSYIAKAEIVSVKTAGDKFEATMQLAVPQISSIIGMPLPLMPSIVKPISMKEYSDKFGPQARATTQRAAQLDGYRKLAELMYGTVISSETTLRDYEVKDDRITTSVEGLVKGAEIMDTQYFSDGSITLTMVLRADLVRIGVAKLIGDVFGLNYFTSPVVIDMDDYLSRI